MSSAAVVVRVDGLAKKLTREMRRAQWYGVRDIARELLGRRRPSPALRAGEFWALRDVSFELRRGESLAVVGGNGAGKSTLLKVLYGLIEPDAGRVGVAGRVGALIELGTGFDPALTGRENIRVSAALHGLDRRRIHRLTDEIVEFAGLEEMVDLPFQYFSSGMQARLSYAVAAHLEPDVLLVDEVLAVGDSAFQIKCMRHMMRYLDGGGSLIFVSHNTFQVQATCQRGLLLQAGEVTFAGSAVETVGRYLEEHGEVHGAAPPAAARDEGAVAIRSVRAEAVGGGEILTGEALRVSLRYHAREDARAQWGFTIWTGDQWVCVTGALHPDARFLAAGEGELHCTVPRLPLAAGHYVLRAVIVDAATHLPLATFGWNDPPHPFQVRALPTRLSVAMAAVNQLTTVDVEWS